MATPQGTVVLHYGPLGITTLNKIQKVLGKGAVIDTNVARMAGASFAFGAPEPLEALRARLVADAIRAVQAAYPTMAEDAQRWLAVGAQGTSSLTLFHHLTGTPMPERPSHPHDLDDFDRCKKLLEEAPSLRATLPRAATLSPIWARIVAIWDELCATLDAEIGAGDRSAPKAAALLAKAIAG